MSHEIQVDAERWDQQMAYFEHQPDTSLDGQGVMVAGEPEPSGWLETMVFCFTWLNATAPNWGVPEEKIFDLSEKAAVVMDQMFPSGPGDTEKLPPWAQFLVCLGGIVVFHGWDFQAMSLKPLTEPDPEGDQPDPVNEAAPKKPGKFSTLGSSDDE